MALARSPALRKGRKASGDSSGMESQLSDSLKESSDELSSDQGSNSDGLMNIQTTTMHSRDTGPKILSTRL